MNAFILLLLGMIIFFIAYITYGSYIEKKWGVDPGRKTPAHTRPDGRDYVPTDAKVLLGHHFSSIAGAGPITGPIIATMYGWLPVYLWIIFGCVFFGGVHDYGSLLASLRHEGKSIGEVIRSNVSQKGKIMFTLYAFITICLVVAAFLDITAGTFAVNVQTVGNIDAIDLAVTAGAKLIVTPGYLFEPAIYKAQDTHPDVSFVLLDGTPQDGTYSDFRIETNVYSVLYAEEQAGFLAGYAVVKEGYTNLGVMAGMAVPAVMRFGYGFLQGANYAAKEMNMPVGAINANYTYLGNFDPTPENQTLANSWYQSGIQVIFAPAGGAGNSVMSAAEQNNALVVGVDIDQSTESSTVITSAMKMLGESVYNAIDDFYNGKFLEENL